MPLRDDLLLIARCYADHRGMTLAALGGRLTDNSKQFSRIAEGGDVGTVMFEKLMGWFAHNWPDDLAWPQEIRRDWPRLDNAALKPDRRPRLRARAHKGQQALSTE